MKSCAEKLTSKEHKKIKTRRFHKKTNVKIETVENLTKKIKAKKHKKQTKIQKKRKKMAKKHKKCNKKVRFLAKRDFCLAFFVSL